MRFPIDLKAKIEKIAVAEGRSFTAQVIYMLKKVVK
jgi:hypothetical protein